MKGKRFVPFITQEQIAVRVKELAERISEDYAGDCPILIVVLNGAMPFATALMQQMSIPLEVCCIKYKSYAGMQSSGQIKEAVGLPAERLKGRRLIVVEDIIDTGHTIAYLYDKLKQLEVKDVATAALTIKRGKYEENIPIAYVGFEISNEFVVGFGMDYDELGRQYLDIYQCTE